MQREPVRTRAVPVRVTAYGESDAIVTLLTEDWGKIGALARSARKSRRRFGGSLELFSLSQVVYSTGRGGLPMLSEASQIEAFDEIRRDVLKFAHASLWVEILSRFLPDGLSGEAGGGERKIFGLLVDCLRLLAERPPEAAAGVHAMFLARFLGAAGIPPRLSACVRCGKALPPEATRAAFDPAAGGIVCRACGASGRDERRETIDVCQKALTCGNDTDFPEPALSRAVELLEAFACRQMDAKPNSLDFLRSLRKGDPPCPTP